MVVLARDFLRGECPFANAWEGGCHVAYAREKICLAPGPGADDSDELLCVIAG